MSAGPNPDLAAPLLAALNIPVQVPNFQLHQAPDSHPTDSTYNPFSYPPDLGMAKKHGKAKRVCAKQQFISSNTQQEKCECCGTPVDNDLIPLCCNHHSLYHLGCCFPLYYHYVKYCIGMLCFVFATSGIYSIVNNVNNADSNETNLVFQYSIFGTARKIDSIKLQSLLNLATIIVILVCFHIFRRVQGLIAKECDEEIISPADYTVMVEGLEGLKYTESDIREFFSSSDLKKSILKKSNAKREHQFDDIQVSKVLLTFDVGELINLSRKREEIIRKRRDIINAKESYKHDENDLLAEDPKGYDIRLDEANLELNEVEDKIEVLEKKFRSKDCDLTGVVFVTFSMQSSAKKVRERWKMMWFTRWLIRFFSSFKSDASLLSFKGKLLDVYRAPEPTDILWENLSFGGWDLTYKRLVTRLATALMIIVGFVLVTAVSMLSATSNNSVIPVLLSLLIITINGTLAFIIRRFAADERQKTYTEYHSSVAQKLSLAMFINSSTIIFFVQIAEVFYFNKINSITQGYTAWQAVLRGVSYQMFYLFLSNAIFTPIFAYLDPFYFYRLYQRKQITQEGPNSKFTQAEANELWEGTQVDMAQNYANIIKTMYMTAFYAPFEPMGVLLSILGLVFLYWVDKYMLLRIHTSPSAMGKKLSSDMIEYLEWFPFFFAFGNLLIGIYYFLENHEEYNGIITIAIIGLGLSLSHIFAPLEEIHKQVRRMYNNNKKIKKAKKMPRMMTYEKQSKRFLMDYERANPVTQEQAEEEYILRMLTDEQDEAKINDLREKLKEIQENKKKNHQKTLVNNLFKYATIKNSLANASHGNLRQTRNVSDITLFQFYQPHHATSHLVKGNEQRDTIIKDRANESVSYTMAVRTKSKQSVYIQFSNFINNDSVMSDSQMVNPNFQQRNMPMNTAFHTGNPGFLQQQNQQHQQQHQQSYSENMPNH